MWHRWFGTNEQFQFLYVASNLRSMSTQLESTQSDGWHLGSYSATGRRAAVWSAEARVKGPPGVEDPRGT